jgi:hypothetical protein
MELTHDPKSKIRSAAHVLELEPVPALLEDAKPAKADDADSSTAASSTPATPLKSAKSTSSPIVSEDGFFLAMLHFTC